jgi:hypothetical protein
MTDLGSLQGLDASAGSSAEKHTTQPWRCSLKPCHVFCSLGLPSFGETCFCLKIARLISFADPQGPRRNHGGARLVAHVVFDCMFLDPRVPWCPFLRTRGSHAQTIFCPPFSPFWLDRWSKGLEAKGRLGDRRTCCTATFSKTGTLNVPDAYSYLKFASFQ